MSTSRAGYVGLGFAQLLLVLVAAWWCVLLLRAVSVEDALVRERLQLEARILAETTGGRHDAAARAASSLEDQARRLARRRLMVVGEGSLLLILVGVSTGMLGMLVVRERRHRQGVETFLARAAHEMKTPLAGLRALLETLRDSRVPAGRLAELVDLGLSQAAREERLLQNMLEGGRVARRGRPLEAAPVELAPVLRDWAAARAWASARVEVSCPAGLTVIGNGEAIRTILDNLADNAFKYGARRVRVEGAAADGKASIAVVDDGEGFPPDSGESLFAPFARHAEGGRHGTGLGLPISRALAREMGGELRGESAGPGRGATFVLTLRAVEAA